MGAPNRPKYGAWSFKGYCKATPGNVTDGRYEINAGEKTFAIAIKLWKMTRKLQSETVRLSWPRWFVHEDPIVSPTQIQAL